MKSDRAVVVDIQNMPSSVRDTVASRRADREQQPSE
jgi:hypothetical protein